MPYEGGDPHYVDSVEVARRIVRGNTGDVEVPLSARQERRRQQRAARQAAKKAKKNRA